MQGSQKTPAMREPSCHWLVGPLIQTPCGRSTNPCTSSGQTGLRRLAHGVERARYVDCQTRFRRAQNLGSGTLVHTPIISFQPHRPFSCLRMPNRPVKASHIHSPLDHPFPSSSHLRIPVTLAPALLDFHSLCLLVGHEPNDKTTAPVESHPSLRRPAVSGDSVAPPLPLSCSFHAMD